MEIELKLCTSCNEVKDVTDFNKDKRPNRSYFAYCRLCQKEYMRSYYMLNGKFK